MSDPDQEAIVQSIAAQLGETGKVQQMQIRRIVQNLGIEAAQAFVAETLAVQAAGGMDLPDGSRKRTPGGVFFFLVRQRLDPELRRVVFPPTSSRPKKRRSGGSVPTFPWAHRVTLVKDLADAEGVVRTVKITLIGRPGKVIVQAGFTLVRMKHRGPLPSLPKGLPVPAQIPETTYVVYVSAKQWRGVAEAIKDEDDALIVEGVQFFDAQLGVIAVLATNTTTRLLQQAKRQPPPAAS